MLSWQIAGLQTVSGPASSSGVSSWSSLPASATAQPPQRLRGSGSGVRAGLLYTVCPRTRRGGGVACRQSQTWPAGVGCASHATTLQTCTQ